MSAADKTQPTTSELARAWEHMMLRDPDAARTRNDVGWNGSDSKWAHRVKRYPFDRWNDEMVADLVAKLAKYAETQLAPAGISYTTIKAQHDAGMYSRAARARVRAHVEAQVRVQADTQLLGTLRALRPTLPQRAQPQAPQRARFNGRCITCKGRILVGDFITFVRTSAKIERAHAFHTTLREHPVATGAPTHAHTHTYEHEEPDYLPSEAERAAERVLLYLEG